MDVSGSVALVTGANRGIGRAFVESLLDRGAAKIYAAARDPGSLASALSGWGDRVVPLTLDVTDPAQVDAAATLATDVTLLINNAGYSAATGALSPGDVEHARREMDVNYFGILRMARAFAPVLAANGGGAIANVLSFLSLATMPLCGTYCASKAAGLALTRSLRAELAQRGTLVVAAMPVQVDTDMGAFTTEAKVSPQDAASDTLDAVDAGLEEVFPGELSRNTAAAFAADPKGVQAHLSTLLPVPR